MRARRKSRIQEDLLDEGMPATEAVSEAHQDAWTHFKPLEHLLRQTRASRTEKPEVREGFVHRFFTAAEEMQQHEAVQDKFSKGGNFRA